MFVKEYTHPLVIQALRDGELVVARTDTIYGVLALAHHEKAVAKLYELKQRGNDKSLIMLIDSLGHLHDQPHQLHKQHLDVMWPGPFSFALPAGSAPEWLQFHDGTVAYRMPAHGKLRALIGQVGPVVAPSANPAGLAPARTAQQAREYFGEMVSVYVDGGEVPVHAEGSRLIRLRDDGGMEILR